MNQQSNNIIIYHDHLQRSKVKCNLTKTQCQHSISHVQHTLYNIQLFPSMKHVHVYLHEICYQNGLTYLKTCIAHSDYKLAE